MTSEPPPHVEQQPVQDAASQEAAGQEVVGQEAVRLGEEERVLRLQPLLGIPAPNAPRRASAVPAYSAPLSFDWRKRP
jgi:hypothetical protein